MSSDPSDPSLTAPSPGFQHGGSTRSAARLLRLMAFDRAANHWINDGWTPWRLAYGALSLLMLTISVYGWVSQPRHRSIAVIIGAAAIAMWAIVEMTRWRIRYRRLAAKVDADQGGAKRLRDLFGDGQVLYANLGGTAVWGWRMARGLPGHVARWEADVSEALWNQPEIRIRFLAAPSWDSTDWNSRPAYDRVGYQLEVLGEAVGELGS
jgi:hypothetical protein